MNPDRVQFLHWFRWAARKVLSRDPLYLPRRLGYSLQRRLTDRTFVPMSRFRGNSLKSFVPADPDLCIQYFRNRKSPRFHFLSGEIGEICSLISTEQKENTVWAAEEVIKGNFTFRGRKSITLDPVNWAYCPQSGGDWRGDLNRHFYFATLGFAYWYTRDIRFADAFFRLSSSWIESFDAQIGRVSWDTPFEVAARINAWIWAYFLFLPCTRWQPVAHQRFLNGLGRLAEYLYRTIEYHNPGNHIMLEAKALALCGGLFPEFKESDLWNKKAWNILHRELQSQICLDGVHAERSTMYHRIIAGELSELLLYCARNHLPAEKLAETVRRMADFESWVAGGLAEMPAIGDAHIEDSYFRFSAPSIAGALFSDWDGTSIIPPDGDQTPWAIGPRDEVKAPPPSSVATSSMKGKAFPSGGYFVSRWGWGPTASILTWDCGPVGYAANPYHAHLDALSFTLSLDGVPILIDPGISEDDISDNREMRGTSAHNTVAIDQQNQSVLAPLGRRNEVWAPARSTLISWASSQDCDVMTGSHDGYCRMELPVRHTRTIVSMRDKYWIVYDRFDGSGRHRTDQRFHCGPGVLIEQNEAQNEFILTKGGAALSMKAVILGPSENADELVKRTVETTRANLLPDIVENVQVINICRESDTPFGLAMVLSSASAGAREVEAQFLESESTDGLDVIEVVGNSFRDRVFFPHGPQLPGLVMGMWETDARVLILRQVDTVDTDLFAIDASFVLQSGKCLLEVEQRLPISRLACNAVPFDRCLKQIAFPVEQSP